VDRERAQKNRVDQTENGSIGPDAERHRDDSERGKAGIFQELANPIANVLQDLFHGMRQALVDHDPASRRRAYGLRCDADAIWIQRLLRNVLRLVMRCSVSCPSGVVYVTRSSLRCGQRTLQHRPFGSCSGVLTATLQARIISPRFSVIT